MTDFMSSTCSGWQKEAPFCEELRNFLSASRKHQTYFANCEGSYSRRTLHVVDENNLKQFICNTMYAEFGGHFENLPTVKRNSVLAISNKITSLSSQYSLGEVHFASVWIHCFDYEKKTWVQVPLFKIYKRKQGNEACFLDVQLNLYENWNHYLQNLQFPQSFLCVPRGGEYRFVDGKLDLEFFTTQSVGLYPSPCNTYQAFYQVLVLPLIQEVKCLKLWAVEKIKRLACYLMNYVQTNPYSTFKYLVLLGAFVVKMSTAGCEIAIFNFVQMLLPQLLNVNRLPLPNSEDSNMKGPTGCQEDNFLRLTRLIKKEEKDYCEILQFSCSIALDSLLPVTEVFRIGTKWIQILRNLFSVLKSKGCEVERVKNTTSGGDLKFRGTTHTNKNCSGTEDRSSQTEETCIGPLSCFNKLGTEFVDDIDMLVIPESRKVGNSDSPIILDVIEGALFCLLPNCTLSRLNEWALLAFGARVSFTVLHERCNNVFSANGEKIGVLYFVNEGSALGVFSVRHIREGWEGAESFFNSREFSSSENLAM